MKHFFESYVLVQQDIITSNEATAKFLSLPGIEGLRSELEEEFYSETCGSLLKWNKLCEVLDKRAAKNVIPDILANASNFVLEN